LLAAVQKVFQPTPLVLAWLRPFRGVFVDDCTQLWLPDDAHQSFPASTDGKARLKLLLRWELQGGILCHLGLHPGRAGDLTTLEQAPPLPKGALHLADLGFTDFGRLQAQTDAGVFWITRLPAQTLLFVVQPAPLSQRRRLRQAEDPAAGVPLWRQLRQWRQQGQCQVDMRVWVGDKQTVTGRLIALACPPEVVARRLARLHKEAQRLCRPVSERQRQMCNWTVLWTNVAADVLTVAQVRDVYRLRWQIELLIRRFKSEGGLGQTTATKKERVEAEWYLKLLGQVVRNWLQSLHGGALRPVNSQEMGRIIVDELPAVQKALRSGVAALVEVLWGLSEQLLRLRPRTARRKNKTAAQRLQEGQPDPSTSPEHLPQPATIS
jgi:hypothetical protein